REDPAGQGLLKALTPSPTPIAMGEGRRMLPLACRTWHILLPLACRSGRGGRGVRASPARALRLASSDCSKSYGPDLQPAPRLLERFVDRGADRHPLANPFHLRAEGWVYTGEFFEGPARNLHHHIVQARLERGRRDFGDVVGDLVECIAHRQQRGDLGA